MRQRQLAASPQPTARWLRPWWDAWWLGTIATRPRDLCDHDQLLVIIVRSTYSWAFRRIVPGVIFGTQPTRAIGTDVAQATAPTAGPPAVGTNPTSVPASARRRHPAADADRPTDAPSPNAHGRADRGAFDLPPTSQPTLRSAAPTTAAAATDIHQPRCRPQPPFRQPQSRPLPARPSRPAHPNQPPHPSRRPQFPRHPRRRPAPASSR